MAKYRRQSILLLVPLLVPILALAWERRKAQAAQTGAERVNAQTTRRRK
jgi:hypothetical protein